MTNLYRDELTYRINIITDAIRDGCLDCGDGLCRAHLSVVQELTLNPKTEVPRLELEIFGKQSTAR